MNLSKLCTPAYLYFVVSIITLIIGAFMNFNLSSFLMNGLFIFVWSWFLNFLCKKGFTVVSWILVIIPYLFLLFVLFFVGVAALK